MGSIIFSSASKSQNLIQTAPFPWKSNLSSPTTQNPSFLLLLHGFSSSSPTNPSPPDPTSTLDPNPTRIPESSSTVDPNPTQIPESFPTVDPSPTHIPESSSAIDPNPTQISEPTSSVRSPRRRPAPPKLEDTICHMMATRKWTTRLQNSIRSLVPNFDDSLVYNVLHGARSSDQALQFFRWVEKNGFHHDRTAHHKIIEILGRASKLNHARCILLDMPKRGVDWDEELFLILIDTYGKAGIVQESVKNLSKNWSNWASSERSDRMIPCSR